MKKAILSLVMAVIFIAMLAVPAFAVIGGRIEAPDDYYRIEIFNEWGDTGKPADPPVVPADKVLEVTFSLTGLDALGLSGYTAYLGTSGDWKFKEDSPHKVSIKGDGTYKIIAKFEEDVTIANVLVIDIPKLASDLGIADNDKATNPITVTGSYKVIDPPATGGGASKTGDTTMIALVAVLFLMAAGASVFVIRKIKA